MRTRYLGPNWELARIRGTPFNTGGGIRMAAVAWDYNAPPNSDRKVGDGCPRMSRQVQLDAAD